MADFIRATLETSDLLAALARVPGAILARVKPQARRTADRIAAEQRRRVARRTGHTARQIRVVPDGDGYLVIANDPTTREHLDLYLEYGTEHMHARPFFYAAANMEAAQYERAVREAIQDAVDSQGLGD